MFRISLFLIFLDFLFLYTIFSAHANVDYRLSELKFHLHLHSLPHAVTPTSLHITCTCPNASGCISNVCIGCISVWLHYEGMYWHVCVWVKGAGAGAPAASLGAPRTLLECP